ncbi:hypothetical protein PSAC2689_180014 [Paraburkholderia sacchari]
MRRDYQIYVILVPVIMNGCQALG